MVDGVTPGVTGADCVEVGVLVCVGVAVAVREEVGEAVIDCVGVGVTELVAVVVTVDDGVDEVV